MAILTGCERGGWQVSNFDASTIVDFVCLPARRSAGVEFVRSCWARWSMNWLRATSACSGAAIARGTALTGVLPRPHPDPPPQMRGRGLHRGEQDDAVLAAQNPDPSPRGQPRRPPLLHVVAAHLSCGQSVGTSGGDRVHPRSHRLTPRRAVKPSPAHLRLDHPRQLGFPVLYRTIALPNPVNPQPPTHPPHPPDDHP